MLMLIKGELDDGFLFSRRQVEHEEKTSSVTDQRKKLWRVVVTFIYGRAIDFYSFASQARITSFFQCSSVVVP